MKRKVTVALTLAALVGLGVVAAFAEDDVLTARANYGPRFAQHMVARRDVGTGGPLAKPEIPAKPHPTTDSMARAGSGLKGHSGIGDALSSGSISPQMALEGSLKSLAMELR